MSIVLMTVAVCVLAISSGPESVDAWSPEVTGGCPAGKVPEDSNTGVGTKGSWEGFLSHAERLSINIAAINVVNFILFPLRIIVAMKGVIIAKFHDELQIS